MLSSEKSQRVTSREKYYATLTAKSSILVKKSGEKCIKSSSCE